MAQGTKADYERAYGLYDKFQQKNVSNWAHEVSWKNDTTLFSYYIDTPKGPVYKVVDADKLTTSTFTDRASMDKAMGRTDDRHANRQGSPFRRHERHWMETDDEQDQRVATSPDGKMDAWVEGYNVVVHQVGRPYSEKHVLTQDGTIGRYYSSDLLWSPDSKKLFTCLRNKVERRYVYYVESSPKDQLQPILHKQEYAKPGDELPQHLPVIIDVETGRKVVADAGAVANQYSLIGFSGRPTHVRSPWSTTVVAISSMRCLL